MEATIVITIIALLAGILFFALRGAKKGGSEAAERAALAALKMGLEQFKNTYGLLPPLIRDDNVASPLTLGTRDANTPDVWSSSQLSDGNPTWNSGDRFSLYSLPVYLVGSLDEKADGVDGPGFTEPQKDGSFSRRGANQAPLFNADKYKTRVGLARLSRAQVGAAQTPLATLLDYWSDQGVQTPIRYYRWLPEYETLGANKGRVKYWNVPFAAGGKWDVSVAPDEVGLRDAQYAIVSAGPDHVFGDEPDADTIRAALQLDPGVSDAAAREMARKDNLVEYGK